VSRLRQVKGVLLTIDHAIGWISLHATLLGGILILIMGGLSTYGVFRRYVLHSPEPYSYELSTIFLLACVMLPIAYLQRQGRHLRVDLISNSFGRNTQDILLNIVVPVIALTYVVVVTWHSWNNMVYSFSVNEKSISSWREPLGPIKMIVPAGAGLLCVVLIAQLVNGISTVIRRIKGKIEQPG
jgi:TRAP-type C4-dicarboxylate transport system permease small subunit